MNDDQLKRLWCKQKLDAAKLSPGDQIKLMRIKMKALHRVSLWVEAMEIVVSVGCILFFAWLFLFHLKILPLVSRIGLLIMIASLAFDIRKPIRAWRMSPQPPADAQVTQWLRHELEKLRAECELSRTRLLWNLLPYFIGVIVFICGLDIHLSSRIFLSAFFMGINLIIYVTMWKLNQYTRRKCDQPLIEELEALLRAAENAALPEEQSMNPAQIIAPSAPPPINADAQPEPPKKNIMTKTILIGIVLISLGAIVFVRGGGSKTPAIEYSDPVSQMLETIREKHNFPALAAAVVVDGKIVVTNAVGFRKNGGTEKVTVDDQFHLGSVTKSMTATVAAMLVEREKISWTTTIGEVFPELKSEIHPDYLGVTLEQLLSHRSGAPGNAPDDLWRKAWAANGTAAEQRLAFIKGILARKPEAKPGTKFIYSNQGYSIAGVMLEKATGKTWEDLLRAMLFEPLGMTTAGFGAPASVDKVDQPWGHTKTIFSGSEPVPPGPGADNPLAISPAGAVHCSMGDLAKYAAFHMAGERGESKLLKAESFKKLHTAVADNDDYALGWMVLKRAWANGRALMHNGSNTMFYVVVWMAPEKNCAVIVASNIGVDEAFEGCDEVAGKLIDQYFGK